MRVNSFARLRIASFQRPALIKPLYLAGSQTAPPSPARSLDPESGVGYLRQPPTPSGSASRKTILGILQKHALPIMEGMTGLASLGIGIAGTYSCAPAILIPGAIISALCFASSVKNTVNIHRRIVKERELQQAAQQPNVVHPPSMEQPSRLWQYALPLTEASLGGASLVLDSVSFAYCEPEVYYPSLAMTALGLIPGIHGLVTRSMRPPEEDEDTQNAASRTESSQADQPIPLAALSRLQENARFA